MCILACSIIEVDQQTAIHLFSLWCHLVAADFSLIMKLEASSNLWCSNSAVIIWEACYPMFTSPFAVIICSNAWLTKRNLPSKPKPREVFFTFVCHGSDMQCYMKLERRCHLCAGYKNMRFIGCDNRAWNIVWFF